MDGHSGQSDSIWMQSATVPSYPKLTGDIKADVCIVGAGIAGMTTAYLLAREGKSVIVIDDGPIGGGQTERTTAHLANAIDDQYCEIERLHGETGARLAAESHTAAIDRIEKIVTQENIDCDFERLDGYLFLPPNESTDLLDREMEAAHRAGLTDVERVHRAPLEDFDTGPCLRFPRQGQFHPLKYLAGLASALVRYGGQIFTATHAADIAGGSPGHVRTSHGFLITASAIVVATNTPVNDGVAIHTKQAAYLTYVIGARVPHGSINKALYWDTLDPYHYVRLQSAAAASNDTAIGETVADDFLIIGGEDHKTGQEDDATERYERLENWGRERFPKIRDVQFRWSGQVMEPIDGLAFIGHNPLDTDNVFIATGDSGMGMTHGTIAGILLTDLIMGRDNPWKTLYDPARKTLRAGMEFAKEASNMVSQYTDWVTPGDVSSPDEIASESGAVLRSGIKKLAVYRDEDGRLHEMSAVCTHLGCIVAWNSSEHTWDCPCHGSRYDKYGHVVNGPANRELAKAETEEVNDITRSKPNQARS
jgi:glycine/D-amino acid oxidase-like deaminating enzyme/nitrite reductase/ring-hydroxylating ferredoxin subunit